MNRVSLWLALAFTLTINPAAAAPPHLSADAWRQDLAVIARELPQRHPNLFHRMSRASWDSAVTATDRRLAGMSRNQALVALMELVALAHDGHTSIHPYFDPALDLRYYPLDLYWFDDGLFVRAASPAYAGLVGARIKRVGKVTADAALAAVARLIPAENEWWTRGWAPQWLIIPEVLDGLGLVADPEQLSLVVERDGRTQTVVVTPGGQIKPGHDPRRAIDRSGWGDMRKDGPAPLWLRHAGEPYWAEYVEREKLLYVGYRATISMDHGESNVAFWRRVFALADSVPVERFVLDIRENIGGNSFFNRQVVRGLIRRANLDRKDRLFVVVGRFTFSASMNLALDLERWTNATFVGEPTGNPALFFGDHRSVRLPNSHIALNVSSLLWRPYDSTDRRQFLAPPLYAPLTSTEYRENRDPVMDVILAARPDWKPALEAAAVRGDTLEAVRLFAQARHETLNRYRSLEGEMNALGYSLLNSGHMAPAITIFRLNAGAYPGSGNAWDSLGETLVMAGRREEGIAAYRRALAVNPDQDSSREALTKLGVEAPKPTH